MGNELKFEEENGLPFSLPIDEREREISELKVKDRKKWMHRKKETDCLKRERTGQYRKNPFIASREDGRELGFSRAYLFISSMLSD